MGKRRFDELFSQHELDAQETRGEKAPRLEPAHESADGTYRVKTSKPPLPFDNFDLSFPPTFTVLGVPRRRRRAMQAAGDTIREIDAKIIGYEDDPEEDGAVEVGFIKARLIMLSRMTNEHLNILEMIDEESEELSDMYQLLFDEDDNPRSHLNLDVELFGACDLLYIDEVRLKKQYRGYGLGLLAIDGLIKSLPSFEMDAIVLCPCALAREEKYSMMDRDRTFTWDGFNFDEVQKKLIKYFELLGFDIWVHEPTSGRRHDIFMGLWTGATHPDAEKVVPHLFS